MPHTQVLLPICCIQPSLLGRHPSEDTPALTYPSVNPGSGWHHYKVTPALEKRTTYNCAPTFEQLNLTVDSYKKSALQFDMTAALADGLWVGM